MNTTNYRERRQHITTVTNNNGRDKKFQNKQVTIVIVTLLGCACATNDGEENGEFGGGAVGSRYDESAGVGYGGGHNYPPKTYHFYYKERDVQGNIYYRNEKSDQSGAVRGTYGYRHTHGLYRMVQYVSDVRGFRASIITNELGFEDRANPASANIIAEKPLASIQHRLKKAGKRRGYDGGYGRGDKYRRSTLASSRSSDSPKIIYAIKSSKCEADANFNIKVCLKSLGRYG